MLFKLKGDMKMKKEKLSKVLTGLIIATLGVLIAIFGVASVLNIYLGVVACVAGACLLVYACLLLSKKEILPPFPLVVGGALIALAIGLFLGKIGVGVIILALVFAVLGGGAGLILYGIYLLTKKAKTLGAVNLIVGVVAVTLAILFLTVNGFEQAFWIITGILIAIYGVFETVTALSYKK